MAGPVPDNLICSAHDLATLPDVAARVAALADNPSADAAAMVRHATLDPALTARLLAAANDEHWGQSGLVDNVDAAVAVLGARRACELAAGLPALRTFPGVPVELATMERYWAASLRVAVAARAVAERGGRGRPGVVFAAGLLLDLGQLVLLMQASQDFQLALERSRDAAHGAPLDQCEREQLSFDHAEFGAALLAAWRLPASLQACVAHHHQPQRATRFQAEVAIVHVAYSLSYLAARDSEDFRDAPAIAPAAWDRCGMDADGCLAVLPAVRREAEAARRLFDA